jgi:hypothetical protein
VVIPWGNSTVQGGGDYPHGAVGPVFKETAYGLVGIAGESRSGDANGQTIRVQGAGGTNIVTLPPTDTSPAQVGVLQNELVGTMPDIDTSLKTPFRPDQPCENQDPPNLNAGAVGPVPQQQSAAPASESDADVDPEAFEGLDVDAVEDQLFEIMTDEDGELLSWDELDDLSASELEDETGLEEVGGGGSGEG